MQGPRCARTRQGSREEEEVRSDMGAYTYPAASISLPSQRRCAFRCFRLLGGSCWYAQAQWPAAVGLGASSGNFPPSPTLAKHASRLLTTTIVYHHIRYYRRPALSCVREFCVGPACDGRNNHLLRSCQKKCTVSTTLCYLSPEHDLSVAILLRGFTATARIIRS